MTGQPSYTFRDTDETPACRDCDVEMVFLEEREGVFGETDVYACNGCGTTVEDRWTF